MRYVYLSILSNKQYGIVCYTYEGVICAVLVLLVSISGTVFNCFQLQKWFKLNFDLQSGRRGWNNVWSQKYNRPRLDGLSQTSSLSIWKTNSNYSHNHARIYNDYSTNHRYLWRTSHSLCQELIKTKTFITVKSYGPYYMVHMICGLIRF